jgi:serine/threonine protein kinase
MKRSHKRRSLISFDPERTFKIDVNDIKLGQCIGAGNFSKVFKGLYQGQVVAVKKQIVEDATNIDKYLKKELKVLKTIAHPNLLRFVGANIVGKYAYLITEFMEGGDLRQLVVSSNIRKEIGHKTIVQLLLDATSALAYLHDRELMHRDIKTQNIVLDGQLRAVLCDFGFARNVSSSKQTAMTLCGTDEFMAPEIIFGMEYGLSADVFSMGIVACEMCCRKAPDETFMVRTPQKSFGLDMEEVKNAFCGEPPSSLVMWIEQCCTYEPDERLNAVDAEGWLRDLLEELPDDSSIPVLDFVESDVDEDKSGTCWSMKNVMGNATKNESVSSHDNDRASSPRSTTSSVQSFELDDGTASASEVALPNDMHIVPSQDFFIEINQLELGREIGRGQFSVVFEGSYEGLRVAVKKQILENNRTIGKYLRQELAVSCFQLVSYVIDG